jgi:plastocyanin
MRRLTRRELLRGLSGLTLGAALGGALFGRWPSAPSRIVLADSAPASLQYVVEMRDFFFDPPGLFIQPGDSVLWILSENVMKDGHSATSYHPKYDKTLRIPEKAAPWNSGLLKEIGATFEQSFTVHGVYDYFCIPHEDSGMVGRIIVAEATGPGTQPVSVGISAAGQSMMPTVDELLGTVGQAFNVQARINTIVFKVQQQTAQEALPLLDALVQDIEVGAGHENSLYERLKALGLVSQLLEGLAQLRTLISAGAPSDQIRTQAETLKALLNKVTS